ncbi:Transcriptional regulator, Xre-family with cupin domain [hydrothermal vent metagenome]|uniref:Transcriptional regulator, Xre-family with cupin domain n=1 Tax=hydrothermal vent metagenome TaxID=652676 RepID=A0A3B0U333_9ZZZZ
MMADFSISERLAKRLKQTRKSKGLSLEATSKLSGVSRSMLSQIERGESSPTVATLWSLTRALQVDFAGLLDENGAGSTIKEIMRANRTPTIDSQGEGCQIRILSPPDQAGRLEVYEIMFTENGTLVSEPHRQGCIEHMSVLEGTLSIVAGNEGAELGEGDTIRYAADCAHAIRANGQPAKALLIVHNS